MSLRHQGIEGRKPLSRALVRLASRLEALEHRLDVGEDVWLEYATLAAHLATVLAQAAPGGQGRLLTTREMAELVGVTPKSLLRAKAKGRVKPAHQLGRLIRWKGSEVAR
jgi:hypothetical protein